MKPRRSQFSGCLIGQGLADAMGSPIEGQSPQMCAAFVEHFVRGDKLPEARRGSVPFGQYTDDTQLARELLQSFLERGGFEAEAYARRIAAVFSEGRIFGYGQATRDAALRLVRGVPWQQAGAPAPSAGNGTAMRAGPVGLLFWDQPARLVEVAVEQGYITHQDPRCSAGSVAIAGAVTLALRSGATDGESGQLDPKAFLAQLAEWVAPVEAGVAALIEKLADWLRLSPEEAGPQIARAGQPDAALAGGWWGISPFVTPSVLWSLYAFLRAPDDYLDAVCIALAGGGDVDTTAAMTGAMSGARLGLSGLGARALGWARHLTDRGTWGQSELVALAEQCHARVVPG